MDACRPRPCRARRAPTASPRPPPQSISGPTKVPSSSGLPTGTPAQICLQARHQRVVDRLVHDQPPQRRAALPRRPDRGEGDRPLGQVEIGRRRDHHRVVAAQLEQGTAEARGDARPELAAHAGRAGGGQQRHARIVDQRLARRRGRPGPPRAGPPAQSPNRSAARSNRACTAIRRRAASSPTASRPRESPQTKARQAFHAQTATGKLNAEITPTTPSGCQVSIIRCPGRSVAMVSP